MTSTVDLEKRLEALLAEATPGEWELQDGCSWRRIGTTGHDGNVLCPTNSSTDRHPDLMARGGHLLDNLKLIVETKNALPLLLTQLREYRTALEARPAMPEREAQQAFLRDVAKEFDGELPGDAWHLYRQEGLTPAQAAAEHRRIVAALPTTGDVRDTCCGEYLSGNNRCAACPDRPTGDVREAAPEREGLQAEIEEITHKLRHGPMEHLIQAKAASLIGHLAHLLANREPASPPSAHDMQEALEAVRKVRDGYASQMKFCDIEAMGYFREFVRRIDAALASSPMDAVKAAVEDEREACARVADAEAAKRDAESYGGNLFATGGLVASKCIAQAIRARAGGAK